MRSYCRSLAVLGFVLLSGCVTGGTPLHRAALSGDIAAARAILAQSGDTSYAASEVLCPAVQWGRLEMVRFLLDSGADPNYERPRSLTPLQWAAITAYWIAATGHGYMDATPLEHGKSLDIINLLLEKGADADQAIEALKTGPQNSSKDYLHAGEMLERIVNKRRAAAQPVAVGGISKDDIKTIVQAAVAGAALAQAKTTNEALAPASDIDVPAYKLAERPADFAVVVGVGKYSDVPEAQFAERDAQTVRDHLLALGFPSRNVVHLSGEKAGYKGIEKFVETWLPRNVDERGQVVFYFSGHGALDAQSGQAYLLPYDGDPNFLENTGYPIRRLYEKLAALKAREIIVAMDACFSGAGGRSVLAKGARPLVMKVNTAAVPEKLTVFAAASGDQITSTLEDQGHGIFTYYFLKGLSGGAKDGSGRITAKGLYNYLKPKVQDAARRQNRDQEPVLHAQGNRELVRF